MPLLEEVFRLSGVPTHTFVEPERYEAIKIALRTPGRCVVLEGPSGIGKTTTIVRVFEQLGGVERVLQLSARQPDEVELIAELPQMGDIGTVVIDDFHRLDDQRKTQISDYVKILADRGEVGSKLILAGINKSGSQLVHFANDLGMRIDVFKLEANPVDKIQRLIQLGERALNITVRDIAGVAGRSQGSFQLAQTLCHEMCVQAGVTETQRDPRTIELSVEVVTEYVMENLSRQFHEPCVSFAQGRRIRREGRAPYLNMLKWLSESEDFTLDLDLAVRKHAQHRVSIQQVIEKGHLVSLLADKNKVLGSHFHYDSTTRYLSVEDPKLIFYLRNIVWRQFANAAGFAGQQFTGAYDLALSFAGADRAVARRLFEILSDREVSVFYDENEQHRILARNIEDYLAPIYRSEAAYVVALLSTEYPNRVWTKFESDQFRSRFGEEAVVSIRFKNVQEGFFSEHRKYGSLTYDPHGQFDEQLEQIADILCKRFADDRVGRHANEAGIALGEAS